MNDLKDESEPYRKMVVETIDKVVVALQPHFAEDVTGSDRLAEMTGVLDNADNWNAMIDLARDENGTRQAELREISQPTLLLWGAEDIAYTIVTAAAIAVDSRRDLL